MTEACSAWTLNFDTESAGVGRFGGCGGPSERVNRGGRGCACHTTGSQTTSARARKHCEYCGTAVDGASVVGTTAGPAATRTTTEHVATGTSETVAAKLVEKENVFALSGLSAIEVGLFMRSGTPRASGT
ncbi:hypothetical protein DIPPA_33360 [Diplonema papillatum]|nr:hypothetical protein DIPPA_33360 [Diplonema papillatum]